MCCYPFIWKYRNAVIALLILHTLCACRVSVKSTYPYISGYNRYEISSSNGSDTTISQLISPYKDSIDKSMNEVIGFCAQPITKDFPEGLLGNFVADVLLETCNANHTIKAHMALVNNGGLRLALAQGNITVRNIYELMPFDNEVVVIEISGATLNQLMASIASGNEMAIAGASLVIKNNKPENTLINGMPVIENNTYLVVTSDYLAMGGSDLEFLKDAIRLDKLNLKVRDILITYIRKTNKNQQTISAKKDGRIRILE